MAPTSVRGVSNANDSAQAGTSGPPLKLIALLLLVVALAVFIFQNTHRTHIEFLWIDASWPVWVVIGVSAVVGALLAKLIGFLFARARRDRD